MTPLDRAIAAAGSQAALASALGIVQGAISNWKTRGTAVPGDYCPSIERETRRIAAEKGDASLIVTCEELRPDIPWDILREQARPVQLAPQAEQRVEEEAAPAAAGQRAADRASSEFDRRDAEQAERLARASGLTRRSSDQAHPGAVNREAHAR